MKRKNATRNALVTSIISLLLCVSMLVGTTFAWFTDTVETGRNTIAAGNLDIKLSNDDGEVKNGTVLFANEDLWEPGVVVYENLTVENVGSLALKYNMDLTVLDETEIMVDGATYKFGDAIKVGVVDNHVSGDRDAVIGAVDNWTSLTDFNLGKNDVEMEAGAAAHEFAIVLYWQPDVDYTDGNFDNIFNLNNERNDGAQLKLEIGLNLYATQMMDETDSFDNTYDKNAKYSDSVTTTASADGAAILQVAVAPSNETQLTVVEAPAGAFAASAEVKLEVETTNTLFNVNSSGAVVASLDVTLTVDGAAYEIVLPDGKVYTVTTYISKGLDAESIVIDYTGDDGRDEPTFVSYDPTTGKLVFTTNHFSEYTVSGKAYGYDIATDTAYATAQDVIDAIVAGNDPTVPVEDKQAVKDAAAGTKDHNTVIKAVSAVQNTTTNKWYISLDKALEAIESGNHTLKLLEDIDTTSSFDIPAGTTITLDMNGMTITATDTETNKNYELFNMECLSGGKSTMTVKGNGTIVLTATTDRDWNNMSTIFHNRGGELNIENGTFIHKGGTDMAYVVDNSTNWIGTSNTATLNVKGGKLESSYTAIRNRLDNTQNSGHGIVNISGGEIIGASRGIWAQLSSKPGSGEINVSGGTITGGKNAIRVDSDDTGASTVSVNVNNATINGEVVPGCASYVVNGVAYVSSAANLSAALTAGNDVVLSDDLTVTGSVITTNGVTEAYGNKVGVAQYGGTLDGNGNTLTETSSSAYVIVTHGGTIKNLTIVGGGRGIVIYAPTEDVIIDNVMIDGPGYAINTAEHNGQDLIVTNSTVNGWTSLAGLDSVSFTNCKFGENSTKCWQNYGYDADYDRLIKPYGTATFTDCTFEKSFYIDLSALADGNTVTLTNCNCEGVVLTAENYANYITVELPEWASSIADCIVFG